MPSKTLANIYATIPQIFYDLIARICPGYFVCFIFNFVFSGTGFEIGKYGSTSGSDLVATLFKGIGFITLCYFISWVLRSFTFKSYRETIKKETEDNEKFKVEGYDIQRMYQCIRINYPQVGYRIVKLRAEAKMLEGARTGMCYIFLFALILFFCSKFNFYSCPISHDGIWFIKLVIPAVFAVSFRLSERPIWKKYYRTIPISYQLLSVQNDFEKEIIEDD